MSNILYADPDAEVSAMCHRNHVERAWVHDQEAMDAHWEPMPKKAKSGPVIHVFEKKTQAAAPERKKRLPTIRLVSRALGALARMGAGLLFLCGVADGLIDTTYGLLLTIICTGWGLLHLLGVVAHG